MPKAKRLEALVSILRYPGEVLTWLGLIQFFVFALFRFPAVGITKEILYDGEEEGFKCNLTGYYATPTAATPKETLACYKIYKGPVTVSILLAVQAIAILVMWGGYFIYARFCNEVLEHSNLSVLYGGCHDRRARLVTLYRIQTFCRVLTEILFVSIKVSNINVNVRSYHVCSSTFNQFVHEEDDHTNLTTPTLICSVTRFHDKTVFLHALLVIDIVSLILALIDLTVVCIHDPDYLFPGHRKMQVDDDSANQSLTSMRYTSTPAPPVIHVPQPVPYFYHSHHMGSLTKALEKHSFVAVTGPHGCGKTQLALNFAQSQQKEYGITLAWWLPGTSASALEHSLYILHERMHLNMPFAAEENANVRVEGLLTGTIAQLSKRFGRILLIFEDVNELGAMIENAFSRRDKFIVILTSNNPAVIQDEDLVVRIEGFSDNETMDFFKMEDSFQNAADNDIVDVGQTLGNLPFGLAVARSYISHAESDIQDYVHNISDMSNTGTMQTIQKKFLGQHHKKTLVQALLLSFDRMRHGGYKEAMKAFEIVAYFSPQDIPSFLLHNGQNDKMDDFLTKLKKYSLVARDDIDGIQMLSVHKAVQLALMMEIQKQDPNHALKRAIFALLGHMERDMRCAQHYKISTLLLPHLESVLKHCLSMELDFEGSIGRICLLNMLGNLYAKKGMVIMAEAELKRAKQLVFDLLRTSEDQLYAEAISRIMVRRRMSFREVTSDLMTSTKADLLMNMLSETSYNSMDENDLLKLLCTQVFKHPDIKALQAKLGPVVVELHTQLTPEMYLDLVEEQVGTPLGKMRRIYLAEIFISILYSYGSLYFCQNPSSVRNDQKQLYISDLRLAKRLCQLLDSAFHYKSIYLIVADRNALLCLDFEYSKLTQKELIKNLEHAKARYGDLLHDHDDYYYAGVLKLTSLHSDPYHRVFCHRQIVRCYILFINLETYADIPQLLREGQKHCDRMLQIVEEAQEAGYKIPQTSLFYNTAAEFVLLHNTPGYTEMSIEYYNQSYEAEVVKAKVTGALLEAVLGLTKIYKQEGKHEDAFAYAQEGLRFAKRQPLFAKYQDEALRLVRQIKIEHPSVSRGVCAVR
ncbi:uncharacterized protein LOC106159679 isoform X2 [Lingula anatina]|uniref:Uncharacterized protein LOC106159679 isoform X2 n=1 Tax=Lingula anatina TaxID=7574 RepID=A0A1S3HZR6_LINAN|nr:uncharacterized protein LOC106159679 isoform X2 [Lingula anatina]|eukprot:XP_013391505.1 uncharacterized protein LOC106159679 isoform X2 [Lingula anatina]